MWAIESYGAPVLIDRSLSTSVGLRGGFNRPVMLASAMVGIREEG